MKKNPLVDNLSLGSLFGLCKTSLCQTVTLGTDLSRSIPQTPDGLFLKWNDSNCSIKLCFLENVSFFLGQNFISSPCICLTVVEMK